MQFGLASSLEDVTPPMKEEADGDGFSAEQTRVVERRIFCISKRPGVYSCSPPSSDPEQEEQQGVAAKSLLWPLWHDVASGRTLVLCRPVTGRTHQLRVHLQAEGHPIANDPCYSAAGPIGDSARQASGEDCERQLRFLFETFDADAGGTLDKVEACELMAHLFQTAELVPLSRDEIEAQFRCMCGKEEEADFVEQLSKAGGAGVRFTHEGELVLDERMIDDADRRPRVPIKVVSVTVANLP